ncbi:MAG: metallophosphoesterase family protein [Verrucomicrobia bacterium]|nr:metallophosphoesterase family protein [Verrucomicrobiota bacterium]
MHHDAEVGVAAILKHRQVSAMDDKALRTQSSPTGPSMVAHDPDLAGQDGLPTNMKIGCISDVHGNGPALRAVISAMPDDLDAILFLGDICGYYPFVDECAELLRRNSVIGVRGNHDQVLIDCLDASTLPGQTYEETCGSALRRSMSGLSTSSESWIRSLPVTRTVTRNNVTFALFHGAPWDPLEGRVYPDFQDWHRFGVVVEDVVLLGQTHYPLEKRVDDKIIVNPGSVGQPRDQSGGAAYAVLDIDTRRVEHIRVPYEPRELIEDAQRHDPNLPYLVDVLIRR